MKNHKDRDFPLCIKHNNTTIENKEAIVDAFNQYFVNIGPNLANELPKFNKEYISPTFNNINTMFLGGVCDSDVLEVVRKFKNKKSTDYNNIDMALIKEVIHCIIKPFTYICNRYFLTGAFPDEMKIAKVFPVEISKHYLTIDQYHCYPSFQKYLLNFL